jgi:hypothetical protein
MLVLEVERVVMISYLPWRLIILFLSSNDGIIMIGVSKPRQKEKGTPEKRKDCAVKLSLRD